MVRLLERIRKELCTAIMFVAQGIVELLEQ